MSYAEHSGHAHYVTATSGQQHALLAGPYRTHAEALSTVDECRAIVRDKYQGDMRATFAGFGTSRVTLQPGQTARDGKLNGLLVENATRLTQYEAMSPNGVSHLVINMRCMTCGDLWRHAEWNAA